MQQQQQQQQQQSRTRYVLRTVSAERKAYGGFVWPESGPVTAPDWDPKPECGNGLHGLLDGQGNAGHLSWDPTALWQVVAVEESDLVFLDDKVKFPKCEVLYTGAQAGALSLLHEKGVIDPLPGEIVVTKGTEPAVSGMRGVSIADFEAVTQKCGISVTGSDGYSETGTAGIAVTGADGTAESGDAGVSVARYLGIAQTGECGVAVAGVDGASLAGEFGTAVVDKCGSASVGAHGVALAGDKGTASAGDYGVILIQWYDNEAGRMRMSVGYIGENGLEPNVLYRVNGTGEFVRVD